MILPNFRDFDYCVHSIASATEISVRYKEIELELKCKQKRVWNLSRAHESLMPEDIEAMPRISGLAAVY